MTERKIAKLCTYSGLVSSGGLSEFNQNRVSELIVTRPEVIKRAYDLVSSALEANKDKDGWPHITYCWFNFLGKDEGVNYEKATRDLFSKLGMPEEEAKLDFDLGTNMYGRLGFARSISFQGFLKDDTQELIGLIRATGIVPKFNPPYVGSFEHFLFFE